MPQVPWYFQLKCEFLQHYGSAKPGSDKPGAKGIKESNIV